MTNPGHQRNGEEENTGTKEKKKETVRKEAKAAIRQQSEGEKNLGKLSEHKFRDPKQTEPDTTEEKQDQNWRRWRKEFVERRKREWNTERKIK